MDTEPLLRMYDSVDFRRCVKVVSCFCGFEQRRIADSTDFCASPGKPGRAVVLRIEPPMASRPFGLPSLTPARFACSPGDRLCKPVPAALRLAPQEVRRTGDA